MYGLTISASTIFQLTTSRRGRPYFILSPGCSRSFNSRPHAEVDSTARDGVYPLCALSTHDLTQRSTYSGEADGYDGDLSTHDLTQRSTSFQVCWIPAIHLSTHDLTQRSTAILTTSCRRNALSTHDLTQRSTRPESGSFRIMLSFNSRPHAKVDVSVFLSRVFRLSFNSRPHAEVDLSDGAPGKVLFSFNSRPHAEVDQNESSYEIPGKSFNSRPHAEVDYWIRNGRVPSIVFQLTTSRRGRLNRFFTSFLY